MHRTVPRMALILVGLLGSALALGPGAVAPPRRVAFLLGVNECQNKGFQNLDWAENDVLELAAELKRLGFDEIVTLAGELREDNGLGMKFRWCPAGAFRMGSALDEPDRDKDEGAVDVTLSGGFWMGQFEVTQSQWRAVMGTTIEEQRDKTDRTHKLFGEGPDYPMYYVNHSEASDFCKRFTESERAAGRLTAGWEYRLPTEAQWESACRAGTSTTTAFGASLGSTEANVDGNYPYNGAAKGPYLEKTSTVGQYRANTWYLYDMHGNVWEWCSDWYAEKLAGGVDPSGAVAAASRVYRGGSWFSKGRSCRSAYRIGNVAMLRDGDLGFRVARVLSGE